MPQTSRAAIIGLVNDLILELEAATEKHKPMASAHEGYAVILEEVEELWEEVRKQKPDIEKMRREALQVAAMGARFALDICHAHRS